MGEFAQGINSIIEDSVILTLSTPRSLDLSGGSHGNAHGIQWPLFLYLIQIEICEIKVDRSGAGSGKLNDRFVSRSSNDK